LGKWGRDVGKTAGRQVGAVTRPHTKFMTGSDSAVTRASHDPRPSTSQSESLSGLVGLIRKANHNKASHNDVTHTLKIWFDPFADSGLNP
jgi:hypothetical protein